MLLITDVAENIIIEKTTMPRIRYERLEDKMNSVKSDFWFVLDRVKVVKISFEKDYFKAGTY
ncbi:hypothetical protein SAMN04489722_101269 [Algibacter lectus]|nr:hypothetical protein SAMN04489722_101269 [Algibacter lectus]